MWLVAADKRVEYAEDIYTITSKDNERGLNLLCPTQQIRSRGDTLNLSTIGIDIDAAFDGVISVEVTHWSGAKRRGPSFELYPDEKPSQNSSIIKNDAGTTLQSGSLSAIVTAKEHNFNIRFHSSADNRTITALQSRSVGLAYSPGFINPKLTEDTTQFKHYMFTQTDLGIGETIHGLGERFGAFNKVGQSIDLWNDDGGTSSDQAYKNIPFWLSSAGYGVFIDTPDRVSLEIGSERCCRLQTSVEGQRLKWYIIYGPSPKEVLTKYSILTGHASMVPAWSFGLWLSTSFTTSYNEKTVNSFLSEMRSREIPVEVFHFDSFWLRAFHWCDFIFSPEHFPDPKGQITRMKEAKLAHKTCVWINPYLGQASPVFAYAAKKGYLVKRLNGDIWQWDLWQTGMGLVDFTNPDAVTWYQSCLEQLFDTGVDCLKTDFGERIPSTGVVWHDKNMDPSRMHNFYAFLYNKVVFEAVEKRFGKNQAVLFARAATAGTQRFPLCWGGDCESTFAALAESLRGGLSLGLSGFSFWSNDIGGFEGNPEPAVYKRWVAFGLLCSHSRLHGSNSYRVPWSIDDGAEGPESCTGVLRTFVRLKRSLMPYLYAQAVESSQKGWPMSVRAMALEFPEDQTAWYCDRQFMLGDSILVAPVMSEESSVQVYFPEGSWTSWWDGKVVSGPRWVTEKHGFGTLPLYVREGSVLLVGSEVGEVGEGFGYDWVEQGGEVRVYGQKVYGNAAVVDATGKQLGTLVVSDSEIEERAGLSEKWKIRTMMHAPIKDSR
jgi:alpha-D-xyloside xylohydrolase